MTNFTGIAGRINRYIGNASADSFRFAAADLDGDTLSGLGGRDLLQITTAGVVGATALANMSGIEVITFAAGGNAITLQDANYADVTSNRITVYGSDSDDTVDASGLTGTRSVEFRAGRGVDVLKGGAGDDVFRFSGDYLEYDILSGGLGNDRLVLTSRFDLGVAAIERMSGIETIQLLVGESNVIMHDFNFVGLTGNRITVFCSRGGYDNVDASQLTGSNSVLFHAQGGINSFFGGEGNDVFRFAAAELYMDTIVGGLGNDTLQFSAPGILAADALRSVRGVEVFQLTAGTNIITFEDVSFQDVAGGRITVYGNSGTDVIDGSALSAGNSILFYGLGGFDVLEGGAGADEFRFSVGNLAADTVNAGEGSDLLKLTTAGTLGRAEMAGVTGIETIMLADGENDLVLADHNFSFVTAGIITVIGGSGADTVSAADLTRPSAVSVVSGAGSDAMTGGNGDDVFEGGAGADTMTGGGNADWFVWRSKTEGGDTITDFTRLEDQLAFDAAAFTVAGDTFDSIVSEDALGLNGIDDVDLLIFNAFAIDSGAEFQAMIASNYNSPSHGMFALVFNSNNEVVLYYTSDASLAASSDPAGEYHQIANLGQLPGGLNLEPSDFVFI